MLALRNQIYVAPLTRASCLREREGLRRALVIIIDAAIAFVLLSVLYGAGYLAGSLPICPALPGATAYCWYCVGPLLGAFIVVFFASLVIAATWVVAAIIGAVSNSVPWGACCTDTYWNSDNTVVEGEQVEQVEEEDITLSSSSSENSI